MLPRKDRCGKTQLAQFNNFSNILLIILIMAEIMQIYMFLSCCGRLGTNFRRKTGRGGSVILLKINALSPTVHLFLSRLLFTHSVPNINVVPAPGPFNKSENSLSLLGTPNSYIKFPNDGKLETNTSFSLLVWILPIHLGLILGYSTDGWGVVF